MLKKALAIFCLMTTMSFAAWDYLPILPKSMGQVAVKTAYMSYDPFSALDIDAGVRYSPLNWLELSAMVPYRLFTSADSDIEAINEMADEMNGIGNSTVGLRFQFTETFGAFVDGYFPGNGNYTEDVFFLGFGVQHSSIFSSVIWATDIEFILGDAWRNRFIVIGDELHFLLGKFVPYIHFDIFYGMEETSSDAYSSDEGGGNGLLFALGFKASLTTSVVLELAVGFFGGDRFTSEYADDAPMVVDVGMMFFF